MFLVGAKSSRHSADPITLSGTGVVTSLPSPDDACVSCATHVLGCSFGVRDLLTFTVSVQTLTADLARSDLAFGASELGSGTFTLTGGEYTATAPVVAQMFNTVPCATETGSLYGGRVW